MAVQYCEFYAMPTNEVFDSDVGPCVNYYVIPCFLCEYCVLKVIPEDKNG